MSKDANHTYVHLHASHHADLFEDFCTPLKSAPPSSQPGEATGEAKVPGHFLAFPSVDLPAHLEPVNPEDEDGVVPGTHAAFGIERAREAERGASEPQWRDLGIASLVEGTDRLRFGAGSLSALGVRREGKRNPLLLMR